ncbi:FAD-dependent oxidoreductase [Lactiplantibacillus daowaiensis]|uniref:FAD-dependent oxidoreductase n=1 Tax=Lactiplantibacillus daowaiensis TaxID=2559918 RepID=A0ABW1RYH6_9LACO|nr:FAD-dependent oxidoreductase [Lactiplantibacillus daowaiensis]
MMTDKFTDVLVIGGGGAGIAAALSADEHGAQVTLIEKESVLGGSTGMSGGGISATNTRFQREAGITDSKDSWLALWHARQATSNPHSAYPDYNFVNYFMDEAVKTTEWLVDYAGHHYPAITGFGLDPVRRIHFAGEAGSLGGPILIQNLTQALKQHHIQVLLNTSAVSLKKQTTHSITGVKATSPDGSFVIHAKAVILATGGFAKNKAMLAEYIPNGDTLYQHSYSGPGNQGDGIQMAIKAGAVPYDEPWIIGEGITTNVPKTYQLTMDWSKLYVNAHGKRFMNEQNHYAVVTNLVMQQPQPWLVLDSTTANQAIISKLKSGLSTNEVVQGATINELATAMNVPVESLSTTITTYNAGADSGKDSFGKAQEFVKKIQQAPFYAVKIYPIIMGTFGGVKINQNFQVLTNSGQPFDNLFATGETANKAIYNQVYMSGSSVQFALTSGRLSGQFAAQHLL